MSDEERRGQYLEHHIRHLSIYLRECPDGSIEFEGSAGNFRTENNDDYEYTLTVTAHDVPKMRAALGLDPGGDVYAEIVRRSREIITRGESRWMTERDVPFEFFAWAPWERYVPDDEMD